MENISLIAIIIAVAVLLGIIVLIISTRKDQGKKVPNYRVLFIVGLTWIPLGISTENPAFLVIGIVLMIIGLANKKKWGKETRWADLSPQAKKTKLFVVVGLSILIVAALVVLLLVKS